jgi:hypothetical protein
LGDQRGKISKDKRADDNILHGVSTTSLHLPAVLASPDSNCFPLHGKLVRITARKNLDRIIKIHKIDMFIAS